MQSHTTHGGARRLVVGNGEEGTGGDCPSFNTNLINVSTDVKIFPCSLENFVQPQAQSSQKASHSTIILACVAQQSIQ